MRIEIENMPTFATEAARLATSRAGDLFGVLTIEQVEMLLKTWVYEVMLELQQPDEFTKPFYNKGEVCELLDISDKTLSNLIKAGKINRKYLGGRPVFMAVDIQKAFTDNK